MDYNYKKTNDNKRNIYNRQQKTCRSKFVFNMTRKLYIYYNICCKHFKVCFYSHEFYLLYLSLFFLAKYDTFPSRPKF